ncbi:conserved domain protein [Actinomyces sp. oral taxon 175 str. F0384]|nr:conserved domain protein [Actinomyces sp. oral taxon 175 str. F0384]
MGGETEVRGWRALAPTFLPGAVRWRSSSPLARRPSCCRRL